jgi:hypothetical protein
MNEKFISNDYRYQNQECHKQDKGFGSNGRRWAPFLVEKVRELLNAYGSMKKARVLDYGCGQNLLYRELATNHQEIFEFMEFVSYDPAIPKFMQEPRKYHHITMCTDVLEHVEPDKLDAVINHLFTITTKGIFINVPFRLGNRLLPDGTPCHKTVKDAVWWMSRIHKYATDQIETTDRGYARVYRRNWKLQLLPPGDVAWDVNIWAWR